MGPRGSVFPRSVEAMTGVALALVRGLLEVRASIGSQGLEVEAALAAAGMEAATNVAEAVVKVAGMGAAAQVDEAERAAEVATRVAATKVAHW